MTENNGLNNQLTVLAQGIEIVAMSLLKLTLSCRSDSPLMNIYQDMNTQLDELHKNCARLKVMGVK